MFRLHKTKPAKSGERIDFKFSQFKLVQVPKGWDKLFVSVISVETGKTVAKSSKATVKNGSCQWTDTVSESISISSRDGQSSSKEPEDCPYKLLVATGSARSGILGEIVVNMATYMISSDSVPVSFPLKKCNHGTVLQFKIHCLTPRTNLRNGESEEANSSKEGLNSDPKDPETKSEESDNTMANSARSYSSRDLGSFTNQEDEATKGGEDAIQEGSFPASDSLHSCNSAEISMEGEKQNLIGGLDSTSSGYSVPPRSSNVDNASQSAFSSFKSHITHSDDISKDDRQGLAATSLKVSASSKSLLEAAEDTISDLRGEVKMWEKNTRKLMLDLELLRKEHSDQSKNQSNLAVELSAACAERDGLQKEVEQLKLSLEKSEGKPTGLEDSEFEDKGGKGVIKELENEIKFQKESNADLVLQLNRCQESNAELVSVLQELEETVEKQKAEINHVTEKNQDLVLQMKRLQESEKFLEAKVQELESKLEHRDQNSGKESSDQEIILQMDAEYECKLRAKEDGILRLKEQLSETQKQSHRLAELESTDQANRNLMEENETLKAKMQELERDCQELTEENLELLVRLKEMKSSLAGGGGCLSTSSFEASGNESQIRELEEKIREKVLQEIEVDHNLCIQELESLKLVLEHKVTELSKELSHERKVIGRLENDLQSKEEQIEKLQNSNGELLDKVSSLQKEKGQLEEKMELAIQDNEIARKGREDSKSDLEIHLSELEQENGELSACISVMESQIRNLTDDRVSIELELENSKVSSAILQDEITGLRNETDEQRSLMEELKVRKVELEEQCGHLEMKLRESDRSLSDFSKRITDLQENICSLLEQSALKERTLSSELDALQKENEKQKKKFRAVDQMHVEMMVQVEKLQREIGDLTRQLSETRHEKERIVSDTANEVSDLRATIAKLELEINTIQRESRAKIKDLKDEIASSRENQEMLKADNEKLLKSLENNRSSEEKFKTALNGLELKLTVSDYERQQLMEECKNLKAQLLKIESLEDEVLGLKNELKVIKLDKENLEISLNLKSEECKELSTEKTFCIDKITVLQNAVSELEYCKQDKVFLEEKLEQMENDLKGKEALCEQEAELKNELNRIKRTNKQLQQQNQQLEEEKQKNRTRAQSLHEDEQSKSTEASNGYKAKRLSSEGRKGWTGSPRKSKAESEFVSKEKFERTKSSLESELKDLRERYFHMSLKYAGVEEEREVLVMKLKTATSGKRWFF